MRDFIIRYVNGHVEVYDLFGRFQFSADTEAEAMEDIRELCGAAWRIKTIESEYLFYKFVLFLVAKEK